MEADIARQVGWSDRVAMESADPDTRGGLLSMLIAALDEIDYGFLLVDDDGRIRLANEVAHLHFGPTGSLLDDAGMLLWRDSCAARAWKKALWQAHQGTRSFISVDNGGRRRMAAVVPLPRTSGGVLVLFGRQNVCEPLSLALFAQMHGLTCAEAAVLRALGDGATVTDIATQSKVAISTVRTQICSVRAKTGATSIRALVGQVATLPPIMSALKLAGALRRCLRAAG